MKILDRYLLRELLFPVLFCLYIIVFLFIIGDVFDNLYEIITHKTPISTLLAYYANLIPFALVQTISWATFLGVLCLFSFLSRNSELIALKACGLTITQLAIPILYFGLIMGVITFVLNDAVVPNTYPRALEIKQEHIDLPNSGEQKDKTILFNTTLLQKRTQYFIREYNTLDQTIKDIRVHLLDRSHNVYKKIIAQEAKWNGSAWLCTEASVYQFNTKGNLIGSPEVGKNIIFDEFSATPTDFKNARQDAAFLSIKALRAHIERLKENGLNTTVERCAFHSKIAFPWHALAIMLIVIPIIGKSGNIRMGILKNISSCLFVVLGYHCFAAICTALGNRGALPPPLSAWLPLGIALIAGMIFSKRANF